MTDLMQSKFELVHREDGNQVKHGESVLVGVDKVEKVDEEGVPYLVFEAPIKEEQYEVEGSFVLYHGKDGDAIKHGGIFLEGLQEVEKVIVNGVPKIVAKVALGGEDYSQILKVKKKEEKKPAPKPTPKPEVKPE